MRIITLLSAAFTKEVTDALSNKLSRLQITSRTTAWQLKALNVNIISCSKKVSL